jgi:hypothetical protein
MLQVLHLDVLKVDRVLHLPLVFCCLASLSPPPPVAGWASATPSPLLDASHIRNGQALRPDVRALASQKKQKKKCLLDTSSYSCMFS